MAVGGRVVDGCGRSPAPGGQLRSQVGREPRRQRVPTDGLSPDRRGAALRGNLLASGGHRGTRQPGPGTSVGARRDRGDRGARRGVRRGAFDRPARRAGPQNAPAGHVHSAALPGQPVLPVGPVPTGGPTTAPGNPPDPLGTLTLAVQLLSVAAFTALLPHSWRRRTVNALLALSVLAWVLWLTGALV